VCLVVLGRHVERLAFLDVMFGDRPALSPPEIFYQRMLAGDPTEAAEKAEQFLKERSLALYYDDVALKGLKLAQVDLEREALDGTRLTTIKETVLEFTENLSDQTDQEPAGDRSTTDAEAAAALEEASSDLTDPGLAILRKGDLGPVWQGDAPILCIAGRTQLDEAAGAMLAHLCRVHGLGTRVEPSNALSTKNIFALDVSGVALVCLSYMNATNVAHIRYAVRRLRRKVPGARIVIGLWSADPGQIAGVREATGADTIELRLRDVVRFCVDQARAVESTQVSELSQAV
jgi:hypothetical protein